MMYNGLVGVYGNWSQHSDRYLINQELQINLKGCLRVKSQGQLR